MKTYLFSLLILCSLALRAHAQFDASYTKYLFNGLAINPAYAGLHDRMDIIVSGRMQWAGMNNAPNSQSLAVHSPVYFGRQQLGVGLAFGNQQFGQSRWINAELSLNYKLLLTSGLRLAMGLQVGSHHFRSNLKDLLVKDPDDPGLSGNLISFHYPALGAGLYLFSENFFTSISASDLGSWLLKPQEGFAPPLLNNVVVAAGYVINVHPNVVLKPHAFGAFRVGAPLTGSINLDTFYKDKLMAGVAYQPENSLRFLIQMQLRKNLRMAYVFELPLASQLRNGTAGTHELVLGYWLKLFKPQNLIVNPRYF